MSEATTAVAAAARTSMKTAMNTAATGAPEMTAAARAAITVTATALVPALTAKLAAGLRGRRTGAWGVVGTGSGGVVGTGSGARSGPTGGGEGGQVGVGPGGQRLTHPFVQFIRCQPALHERGLEGTDHLFAVGVGRPEAALARCALACGLCHDGTSPLARMQGQLSPAARAVSKRWPRTARSRASSPVRPGCPPPPG